MIHTLIFKILNFSHYLFGDRCRQELDVHAFARVRDQIKNRKYHLRFLRDYRVIKKDGQHLNSSLNDKFIMKVTILSNKTSFKHRNISGNI